MVKSIFSCCVRGRRVFSNPVTNGTCILRQYYVVVDDNNGMELLNKIIKHGYLTTVGEKFLPTFSKNTFSKL